MINSENESPAPGTLKTLADDLCMDLANREDNGLKDSLERITRQYFEAGLESLAY
jgi:hypothetical protein